RHQHLDRAGAILLLAHDPVDLAQHAQAKGQERIDAGRLLPQHAGTQHQAMGGDLRLPGGLAQDRQEVAGEAHAFRSASLVGPPTETGSAAKTQGLSKPSDRILTPAAASRTAPLWCAARAETAGSMAST